MLQDLFHFLLLLNLSPLRLRSDIPSLDIAEPNGQLNVVNCRRHLRQLLEYRHDNVLDEAGLSAGDIGRIPVAEHGDLKALRLFHISLVEEFFEEQVGPLGAHFEFSQGRGDVAGVDDGVGD